MAFVAAAERSFDCTVRISGGIGVTEAATDVLRMGGGGNGDIVGGRASLGGVVFCETRIGGGGGGRDTNVGAVIVIAEGEDIAELLTPSLPIKAFNSCGEMFRDGGADSRTGISAEEECQGPPVDLGAGGGGGGKGKVIVVRTRGVPDNRTLLSSCSLIRATQAFKL